MMIKRFLLLFMLACTAFLGCRAQGVSGNSTSESMMGLYRNAEQCIANGDHKLARIMLRITINLADLAKDTELKKKCANLMGTSFCQEAIQLVPKQDFRTCEALLDSAIAVFDTYGMAEESMTVRGFKPSVHIQYGTFEECEALYRQAYDYAQAHGYEDQQVVMLKEMGLLQRNFGHDVEAVSTFLTIDSIGKVSRNPEVQIEAKIAIGQDAQSRGLWTYALVLYGEVFDIVNDLKEKRTDRVIQQMQTAALLMRNVQHEMKLHDKALWYTQQILKWGMELAERVPPANKEAFIANEKKNYYLAASYDYALMKDREKALCLLDSAKAMLPANASVMDKMEMAYNGLSTLYALQEWNRLLEAIQATEPWISTESWPNENAQIQKMKGEALANLKRFEEAAEPTSFFAQWCKEKNGNESPEYVGALLNTSWLAESVGKMQEASAQLTTAFRSFHGFLKRKLPFMSEEERSKVLKITHLLTLQITKLNLKMLNRKMEPSSLHDFSRMAFNALLMQNGLLLNAESTTLDWIKKHGSQKDASTYRYLQDVKENYNSVIADLTKHQTIGGNSEDDNAVLMMVNHEAWHNDLALTKRYSEYSDMAQFLDDDFQSVANALHDGEVLVCLNDLQKLINEEMQPYYVAYLLRKGEAWPTVVELCEQAKMDSLIKQTGNAPYKLYSDETARELAETVLSPLLPHLKKGDRIYWQPAGTFHQIAVGALPLPGKKGNQGERLFGDAFELVQISSARSLLQPEEEILPHPNARLYGGLAYDMTEEEMLAESQKYESYKGINSEERGTKGKVDSFKALSGSLMEVDSVANLLRQKLGTDDKDTMTVKVYRGKAGTQESFEAMSGKAPAILHMATHGFCFQPNDDDKPDGLRFYSDAMSLSGLVLAGGNAGWKGEDLPLGVRSGLLTAEAIAKIDLTGMRLATLAACDTGLGRSTPEGVYGLMRAFKKSRVRYLVMTLWNASDYGTLIFMTEFYRNLNFQTPGWDIRQAFKKAQLKVRSELSDPYYWACFVLVE